MTAVKRNPVIYRSRGASVEAWNNCWMIFISTQIKKQILHIWTMAIRWMIHAYIRKRCETLIFCKISSFKKQKQSPKVFSKKDVQKVAQDLQLYQQIDSSTTDFLWTLRDFSEYRFCRGLADGCFWKKD